MLYLSQQTNYYEQGQGLVEYAAVLAFIAVIVIAVLVLLGPDIGVLYSRIVNCVPPTATCS